MEYIGYTDSGMLQTISGTVINSPLYLAISFPKMYLESCGSNRGEDENELQGPICEIDQIFEGKKANKVTQKDGLQFVPSMFRLFFPERDHLSDLSQVVDGL